MQRFVLELPDGELEVIGTHFGVRVDPQGTRRVEVTEGRVALRLRDALPISLGAGESWTAEREAARAAAPPSLPAAEPPPTPAPAAAAPSERSLARARQTALPETKRALESPSGEQAATGGTHDDDFARGMAAFGAGDYGQAERLFQDVERRHAENARRDDSTFLRAVARARRGDAEGARATARQYLERYPTACGRRKRSDWLDPGRQRKARRGRGELLGTKNRSSPRGAMLKKWLTMVADAGTRRAAVFCAGLVLGWTGLARADDAKAAAPSPSDLEAARRAYRYQAGVPCPYCTTTADSTHPRTGLHWHDHWQKVGLREYLTIPLLGATYLGMKLWPAAEGARWDSPILFDDGARKQLRLHSASGRKTAETVSNILFYAEVIHPVVIDPLLVAWGLHQSPSVAWQMSVINAQAYALTLVLNETVKRLTSRKRPFVDACDRDPTGASCASGSRYRSFYSGHAAVTATGAGLICAHHTQLTLYQSNVLDTGTCVTAIAGTAVTGAMRIMADNHWVSDVLVGHLMGYLSGYLLPTLLYYEEFRTAPHDHAPERPGVLALPIVNDHSLQLSLFGQF